MREGLCSHISSLLGTSYGRVHAAMSPLCVGNPIQFTLYFHLVSMVVSGGVQFCHDAKHQNYHRYEQEYTLLCSMQADTLSPNRADGLMKHGQASREAT